MRFCVVDNDKLLLILFRVNVNYEFKNMDDAIKKMLKIENLEVSFIDKNLNYELWLNVTLERKKLPKPLQVNFFDSTWNIKSKKTTLKIGKSN